MLGYNEPEVAARTLRLQLQSVEVRRAEDLDRALSAVTNQRAQGLIVQGIPIAVVNRIQIVSFAQTVGQRIAFVGLVGEFAPGLGPLLSWNRSFNPDWCRILVFNGENYKRAPARTQSGQRVRQSVLARGDKVIE